jgi:seryl-tRNA synthetase
VIDVKLLRERFEFLKHALAKRDQTLVEKLERAAQYDKRWREVKKELDTLRAQRNALLKTIAIKKRRGEEVKELIERSAHISHQIKQMEEEEKTLHNAFLSVWYTIPNVPHSSTPEGEDETQNVEIRRWGKVVKEGGEAHYIIGERLKMMDFDRGRKMSGHRFVVLWDKLAKLERALINFMLDLHSEQGYKEVWVPHLVKKHSVFNTGQLPKFEEDLYSTQDDLYLIPTAEVSLVNLHAGERLDNLPLKYMAYTPCYRREAGAYGKDIRGMIRQHQFDKVELVWFSTPQHSYTHLETLVRDAEEVLKRLELPYRVVALCTGDLGFCATKTYDIEVWIPSQNTYREISSCSNCEDFQARRARIKTKDGQLVHTLNGSGVAVGRTLVALLENFVEDAGVRIPRALQPYTGFDYIHFQ